MNAEAVNLVLERTAERSKRIARVTLVVFLAFGAVSAIGGAIALLITSGLGMPPSMLDGTPFTSFVIPALILFVVVGGTQGVALALLARQSRTALLWSAIAGFGMIVWIMVETVMIQGFSALQAVYFSLGIAQLALVVAMLWTDHARRGN